MVRHGSATRELPGRLGGVTVPTEKHHRIVKHLGNDPIEAPKNDD
jgi:hypothetical protein